MRRIGLTILALSVGGLLGCQKADSDVSEKLDQIDKKLTALDKKLDTVGARGAARRPARPPGPDPKKVYAAPIAGAAFEGPQYAKVTIVEAFEYA